MARRSRQEEGVITLHVDEKVITPVKRRCIKGTSLHRRPLYMPNLIENL